MNIIPLDPSNTTVEQEQQIIEAEQQVEVEQARKDIERCQNCGTPIPTGHRFCSIGCGLMGCNCGGL